MKKSKTVPDVDGNTLKEGDSVILLNVPDELLSGLPTDDQVAINSQVGKAISVLDFDEHGQVELEFTDKKEMIHFIWVNSLCLRKLA